MATNSQLVQMYEMHLNFALGVAFFYVVTLFMLHIDLKKVITLNLHVLSENFSKDF